MSSQPRTVVITGAAGGVGAELLSVFAAQGDRVFGVDFSPSIIDVARARGAVGVRADVSDPEDVAAAVAQCGPVDVLVNNAGVIDRLGNAAEAGIEEWNRVMAINATGAFLFCNAVLPGMIDAGRGAIVNVASVAGLRGGRAGAAYTASKWALVGLTMNIAALLGRSGVRANAICPGSIATPMGAGEIQNSIFPSAREALARDAGKPPAASPREIAEVALFLASPAASRINGVALPVDAGWIAF